MIEFTDTVLNFIEKEKGIHLPICIFKNEELKKINIIIKNGSPFALSFFFKEHLLNKVNSIPFDFLTKQLTNKRIISDVDKFIIKNLCENFPADPFLFFSFIGNLYYVIDVLEEVNNNSEISLSLKSSALLWCYLNLIELLSKYVSLFLKEIVEKKTKTNKDKIYNKFLNCFNNNKHPEIGKIINILNKLNLITDNGESIFSKGKLIRNAVSHANIYYDKDDNSFWLSNNTSLTFNSFTKYLNNLCDFLLEFIYQLNNNSADLKKFMNDCIINISNAFQRIERSGYAKKRYREIVIT